MNNQSIDTSSSTIHVPEHHAVTHPFPQWSKFLALDLGPTCGFAVGSRGFMVSGEWNLKVKGWPLATVLHDHLDQLVTAFPVDVIYFYSRNRKLGKPKRTVQASLETATREFGARRGPLCEPLQIGLVKKSFTAWGNATDEIMTNECVRRGFNPQGINEVNATALLDYAFVQAEGSLHSIAGGRRY